MWVLMIVTFAATNPPNLNYSPTIFSQEYSSKEKCEAARATLHAGFLAQVEALNRMSSSPRDAPASLGPPRGRLDHRSGRAPQPPGRR